MQEDNINTFLQPSNSISSISRSDVNRPDFLKEQDRFLPIANVSKIMKKDIPLTAKIAKEAKECIQECASEFISFISSEAAEICQIDKRKTINGEDILQALASLGFEKYIDPLQKYLQNYRELNKFENGLIDMNTSCCNAEKHWSILSSTKLNYNFGNVKLSMPKLLSMLPLTDLTSNNLNLESLLQDSDFQRAVLNHLKMQSTDEDSFNIEEGL